jgi:site-specific DNA-cytosine methylase
VLSLLEGAFVMKVLDLWSGTASATKAFEDHGHEVITVEIDPRFKPTICSDIMEVTIKQLREYGPFNFGWASPECTVYSVANLRSGHFKLGRPATAQAFMQNARVKWTMHLLNELCPQWVMENPRGMLRKQPFMENIPRVTVTYCQYGDFRMKPTDLWGKFPPAWFPRPMCRKGDTCHEAAKRGSKKGTQNQSRDNRIMIPYELGESLLKSCSKSILKIATLEDF